MTEIFICDEIRHLKHQSLLLLMMLMMYSLLPSSCTFLTFPRGFHFLFHISNCITNSKHWIYDCKHFLQKKVTKWLIIWSWDWKHFNRTLINRNDWLIRWSIYVSLHLSISFGYCEALPALTWNCSSTSTFTTTVLTLNETPEQRLHVVDWWHLSKHHTAPRVHVWCVKLIFSNANFKYL